MLAARYEEVSDLSGVSNVALYIATSWQQGTDEETALVEFSPSSVMRFRTLPTVQHD